MLSKTLPAIRNNIIEYAKQYGRLPNDVTLLAVSKKQSVALIREAHTLGQQDFGENYLQEALDKQKTLKDLAIHWHFIGQIQSNKTRAVAENFNWVHSVDRLKVAQRLSSHREQTKQSNKPLYICLQLNIDNETSKAGFTLDNIAENAKTIAQLPNITLRGLMAIPKAQDSLEAQRRTFAAVKQCFEEINVQLDTPMDTLSMGMSNDIEAAIAEGSTIVRIGTALFGSRN